MDAVDPDRFARITRVANGYDNVLAGIRAARRAGLWPLKVNCVLMRGFNEDQIIPFGMFAREEGVIVRFIEFMPLEEDARLVSNTVVTLDEILAGWPNTGRWSKFRMRVARRRGAIASTTALARSASSRPYRIPFAGTAAASASPVTERFVPACFRFGTTICTRRCGGAPATKNWRSSSAELSRRRKNATISANQILFRRRARWFTSGGRV